jgi:molybdopterin/thiamine biosynthesis adenylyltransferase
VRVQPGNTLSVVVVGLGGIGSWLLRQLVPLLAFQDWHRGPIDLVLVDGDTYDHGNKRRQLFGKVGPKAVVSADWANRFWGDLTDTPPARAVPRYLGTTTTPEGDDNPHPSVAIDEVIHSGAVVFSCVDNNATRKLLIEHCATLKDVELYNGGNEYTDGNAWVYVRDRGRDVTPHPLSYHPDIASGQGKRPDQMSCDELAAAGTPQLILANNLAATLMLSFFHAARAGQFETDKPEAYFDINKVTAVPRQRVISPPVPAVNTAPVVVAEPILEA